jgi:beta-glucanase (GH16 family)
MYKNTFFYVWYIVTVSLGLLGASVAQDFDPRFAASKSIQRRQVSEDASAEVDAASQDAGLAIVAPTDSFQAVIVEEDIYGSYEENPYEEALYEAMEEDAAVSVAAVESPSVPEKTNNSKCESGYTLVWFDDFDSSKSIKSNWNYVLGNGTEYGLTNGWGNGELQTYTSSSKNVRVSNGYLKIIGRRDDAYNFTSGKVRTYGTFAIGPSGKKKVRIDMRVKIPRGTGLWPSITMLPEDSPEYCLGCGAYGDWAQSGAITLAQRVNKDMKYSGGILYGGAPPQVSASTFDENMNNPADFHTFSLDWTTTRMKWMLDGKTVYKAKSGRGDPSKGWYTMGDTKSKHAPFNKPFYILVGMALGGDQTEASAAQLSRTLRKPQAMSVDYIRVCEK